MPKRTSDFRQDLLVDLADPEEASHYLNAALSDSEQMALVALRDVAEARQMAKVAKEAGVAREALYRMLSESGNPTFGNLASILKSVGLKLLVAPIQDRTELSSKRLTRAPFQQKAVRPSMGKAKGSGNGTGHEVGRLIVLQGGAQVSNTPDSETGMIAASKPADSEHMEMMEHAS